MNDTRRLDTRGVPDSPQWLAEWFPEYLDENGRVHKLSRRPLVRNARGPNISGTKSVRENRPYWFLTILAGRKGFDDLPDTAGTFNMHGYAMVEVPSDKPWKVYQREWATEAEYERLLNGVNFFRNDGRTMDGGPGLNPHLLIGGFRVWGARGKAYECPQGIYTPARRPSRNHPDGRPATFTFNDGREPWAGDHFGPGWRQRVGIPV